MQRDRAEAIEGTLMFKLFNRDERFENIPQPIESPLHAVTSSIADVEFVGTTAVATLTVTDLCTGSGVEQLADLLYDLANCGGRRVVLDMQNVQAIDSACLGCLVSACNQLTEDGVKLAVANAGNTVHQVFKLTRLDRVFPICGSVLAALEKVEGAAKPE